MGLQFQLHTILMVCLDKTVRCNSSRVSYKLKHSSTENQGVMSTTINFLSVSLISTEAVAIDKGTVFQSDHNMENALVISNCNTRHFISEDCHVDNTT